MKNILKPLLILSALIFFPAQTALAGSYGADVGSKVAHGITNTSLGVVEVPKNMLMETNTKGLGYGLTTGLLTGIIYGVARTGDGLVELASFPLPSEPLIQPGYVWQDFSTEPTRVLDGWI